MLSRHGIPMAILNNDLSHLPCDLYFVALPGEGFERITAQPYACLIMDQ